MISDATKAPGIEPSPPTTTTISASSSTSLPTPGVTCSIGPPMTPANVASAEPASSTDSVTRLDVVAERRDHRAVLDGRPQDRAELRPLEDDVGDDRDHERRRRSRASRYDG